MKLKVTQLVKATPEAFDLIVENSNLGEKSVAAARAVLVDGRQIAAVARELGISEQRIYNIIKKLSWHYALMLNPVGALVRAEVDMQGQALRDLANCMPGQAGAVVRVVMDLTDHALHDMLHCIKTGVSHGT